MEYKFVSDLQKESVEIEAMANGLLQIPERCKSEGL
jgi:hypothetical protein